MFGRPGGSKIIYIANLYCELRPLLETWLGHECSRGRQDEEGEQEKEGADEGEEKEATE